MAEAAEKQQRVIFSSASVDWHTPRDLFARLDAQHHFTLDAAASAENKLCARYCSLDEGDKHSLGNGLVVPWVGESVWCNPPYGKLIRPFMTKANAEAVHGTPIVMLVPSRTDTAWWHEAMEKARVVFVRGRLRFNNSKSSAPFPSALLYWNC